MNNQSIIKCSYEIFKLEENGKSCNDWVAFSNDINFIYTLFEGYQKNMPNAKLEIREVR